MEEQKKMLGTMILFFIVITLFWQTAGRLTPVAEEFFKEQAWLTGIISANPLISIIIFTIIISLYTNLFYKFGVEKETLEKMKEAKRYNREMQEKIKEHKDNPQKMAELQKEMLSKSFQNMSLPMKTMFSTRFILMVTLPSLIFLFLIIGPIFRAANVGYIINWGFSIFGRTGAGWLLSLILLSLIFTPITKKLLKLDF